ncbi:early nodulin-like protein 14 [Zostera marina]|uniref:Early nodulin-like protein 14 n=1 Tax=Zostera marina TaxID=29655 RepID=A0A0K9NRC3_ZOSMR|nr:early nodulin-like protein 14 [Zostera marina]
MKISYILGAIVVLVFCDAATAVEITVGGASDWGLGFNYTTWASSQTFTVGDTLDFKYTPGQHNVLEVTKANYDSCDTSNPISKNTTGNDKVLLTEVGTRYFICGFTGHCAGGMKLAVDVVASGQGSTSPSPAVPSPAVPSPPPPPPPPAASSADGLKITAAALFGLVMMAFTIQ